MVSIVVFASPGFRIIVNTVVFASPGFKIIVNAIVFAPPGCKSIVDVRGERSKKREAREGDESPENFPKKRGLQNPEDSLGRGFAAKLKT